MTRKLRIAVADDEPDMQDYFERILPRLGHEVVSVAATGRQLLGHCREMQPDLIITDIRMPDMDGIEAALQLYKEITVPIILVSAYHTAELIERAEADHIMAYLIKPVKQSDLEPAIALAMRRFDQLKALQKEVADLRQALKDGKMIEQAKGIIMRRAALDEEEAFRRLQKMASERDVKLVEIALRVLTDEEGIQPPPGSAAPQDF